MWIEKPGEPGRVNEELLSMLQASRVALYSFIYRTNEKFESVDEAIEQLSQLRCDSDGSIVRYLQECSANIEGITEVLADDQNATLANRLLQLKEPRRQSRWVCSSTPRPETDVTDSDAGSYLWLEYSSLAGLGLPVGGPEHRSSCLELSELRDFQASIVLGSTAARDETVELAIAKFNAQFNWLCDMCEAFVQLHHSGHFDYVDFEFTASFDEDPEVCTHSHFHPFLHLWVSVAST